MDLTLNNLQRSICHKTQAIIIIVLLGVIPSGQENHSKTEHLNFPGRELSVINITEQYFL